MRYAARKASLEEVAQQTERDLAASDHVDSSLMYTAPGLYGAKNFARSMQHKTPAQKRRARIIAWLIIGFFVATFIYWGIIIFSGSSNNPDEVQPLPEPVQLPGGLVVAE